MEDSPSGWVGPRGVHSPVSVDDGPAPGAPKCKVVGTGPELGNVEPGGPRGNPQDLLIAQRAPSLSEVPRNKAAGRVVTPTDATAIWTPARAKDPITAGAQTAPGHADVRGSGLTEGPVLYLLRVADVEAEAAGPAVQFTALGALDLGEGLPLVELAHELLGVEGSTLQCPGVWLLGRAGHLAAGSQLLGLPRTSRDRAAGGKEAPERTGGGSVAQQRQPAIRLRGGPPEAPPRPPGPPALLAPAPRDRGERVRGSPWLPGAGPALGARYSWLRGQVEGATLPGEGGREGLSAGGLGSMGRLRGGSPGSGQGSLGLNSPCPCGVCWEG